MVTSCLAVKKQNFSLPPTMQIINTAVIFVGWLTMVSTALTNH